MSRGAMDRISMKTGRLSNAEVLREITYEGEARNRVQLRSARRSTTTKINDVALPASSLTSLPRSDVTTRCKQIKSFLLNLVIARRIERESSFPWKSNCSDRLRQVKHGVEVRDCSPLNNTRLSPRRVMNSEGESREMTSARRAELGIVGGLDPHSETITHCNSTPTDYFSFVTSSLSRFAKSNSDTSQSHRRCQKRSPIEMIIRIFRMTLLFLFFQATTGSGVWWSPGSGIAMVNTSSLCRWSRQAGSSQFEMCQQEPALIKQIKIGIESGMSACRHELRNHRWNCTQRDKVYFARTMNQDGREAGFVRAITAASITYQLTRACARGDIQNCRCVGSRKLKNRLLRLEARRLNVTVNEDRLKKAVDNFEWGGCRDKIEYGTKKSRAYLRIDANRPRKRGRLNEKIQRHNEEVGRRAIKKHMKRACTCHGLTGSCTMWTCWKVMPSFAEVSKRLGRKYTSAVRVKVKNDGRSLKPVLRKKNKRRREKSTRKMRSAGSKRQSKSTSNLSLSKTIFRRQKKASIHRRASTVVRRRYKRPLAEKKKLSSDDIIFFKESSDFCNFSKRRGSLGTRGRLCNPITGHCKYLCCGRGYQTINVVETKSCGCLFKFCCDVDCKICTTNTTKHFCN